MKYLKILLSKDAKKLYSKDAKKLYRNNLEIIQQEYFEELFFEAIL
jgi:hypothetical protein